jgi:hypothetical protein
MAAARCQSDDVAVNRKHYAGSCYRDRNGCTSTTSEFRGDGSSTVR